MANQSVGKSASVSGAGSKIIVLTGVSRGLGQALVPEFIQRGHTVIGCARAAGAIATLSARYPAPHQFSVVDLASTPIVESWCRQILTSVGTPDLVINNAATINDNAPLWQVPAEQFAAVVDINITAVFTVIRCLLPSMLEVGSGVLVNLSSGWGRSTAPEVAPYCASKWAIEGMTLALASELPAGLAAVPLSPGVINTDMLQNCLGAEASTYAGAKAWASVAAPFLLDLDTTHNGQSLTVPDF